MATGPDRELFDHLTDALKDIRPAVSKGVSALNYILYHVIVVVSGYCLAHCVL